MNILKFLFSKPEWKKRGYRSREEFIFFHPEYRNEKEIMSDKLHKENNYHLKNIDKRTESNNEIFYCWFN